MLKLQQRTQPFDPQATDEQTVAVDQADVEAELLAAERRQALRDGFRMLSDQCRALLTKLMTDPPPSYADVSTQLDLPIGSIGPTRIRCLNKLRKTPGILAVTGSTPEGGVLGAGVGRR